MNRTLFYDRQTGELLHSHYQVRAIERRDGREAELSAPTAVELDADLAELMSRGLDLGRLGSVTTSAAPQSSRRTVRFVDLKTGRLRSRRLEPTDAPPEEDH